MEQALVYYLRGYAQSAPEAAHPDLLGYLRCNPNATFQADGDQGYTGINAAFLLDLLAYEEDGEAFKTDSAAKRRAEAQSIRAELSRSVPPLKEREQWLANEWWFYATIGEAFFGLERYAEALTWLLEKPAEAGLQVPEWEYESTARRLTQMVVLKHAPGPTVLQTEAGIALCTFLQGDASAVRSAFRGKFGLALSGGGFRASLYHIGVLARLAELDQLRHIEVLSCVSGGAIIGAYYYLEVRHLLQTKTDDAITRADYIAIVKRLEERFFANVQRNIRMRVLAEFTTNLKMVFWPGYSRTRRVGELYERELFSRVEDGEGRVEGPRWLPTWAARRLGYKREPRWLNDLDIHPCVHAANGGTTRQTDFKPRTHNWRRSNKAPVLILNATTLNTGHIWQFTTSYMGEPPMPIKREINTNYRLRRMYYGDAPARYRRIRLGDAVAASSCVPGLFEPLMLDGLYPDRQVLLVDGGVCDNQGVVSLLEQDCTALFVSDASGQMATQNVPNAGAVGVLLRTNGVLMARIREAQCTDLAARTRAGLLRAVTFVHLKHDLLEPAIAWVGCPSARAVSDFDAT